MEVTFPRLSGVCGDQHPAASRVALCSPLVGSIQGTQATQCQDPRTTGSIGRGKEDPI